MITQLSEKSDYDYNYDYAPIVFSLCPLLDESADVYVAFLSWGVGNNWLVYDVRYATKRYAPSSLEIE